MPNVGDVLGIKTKNVIGKDSAFKWHFCICARDRLYLFVCEKGYVGDFPIKRDPHCSGLEYEISHLSLSRYMHVPDAKMRGAKQACTVNDDYLREFLAHVTDLTSLSERDRTIILRGLERHFNSQTK